MAQGHYGFIGIGNMGGPIAGNMAANGFSLIVHDKAGVDVRAPEGAADAATADAVWEAAETVFLCLPDGAACAQVVDGLLACDGRVTDTVIDLSTIGSERSQALHGVLAEAGVAYVDSPVSGGVAGARAATITVMWAGPEDLLERHRPVLDAISGNIFHVSGSPGKGQAMKLINNFLSATNLAATAEAMAYGVALGLDMKAMLDVVNVSTGRNTASEDKFPNRILTGTYDAGFTAQMLNKDVQLFIDGEKAAGLSGRLGPVVGDIWQETARTLPGSDITEVYKYMRKSLEGGA